MIAGVFHPGSGVGNQLHRYVMTRVLAADKGLEFGMINTENFKGASFMNLDMGVPVHDLLQEFEEKKIVNEQGADIRGYDWEGILNVKDFTLIDGEFQGEKYFEHHMDEIREWLKVPRLNTPDDLCVIGFRGGEYRGVRDLYLPLVYWETAIYLMETKYPGIRFEVHTDDVETAKNFFPDFDCVHDVALNWRSVRYAKHLIIANSSFYILPALLGKAEEIIAPNFWAGYNVGYWKLPQNEYKRFQYI
jgi:hypothetical protein